jgi:hypothetical protein
VPLPDPVESLPDPPGLAAAPLPLLFVPVFFVPVFFAAVLFAPVPP